MANHTEHNEERQEIEIQDMSSHTSEKVEVIHDVDGILLPKKSSNPSVKKVLLDNIKRKQS